MRHSTQIEKNNFVTQLAAKDEEIRHLKSKLDVRIYNFWEKEGFCVNCTNILEFSNQISTFQVIFESRAIVPSESDNEKFHLLQQERKLLEQRLEETHLHLMDIKSNWSNQNLSLETQLARLSRQVSEETTEKRKVLEDRESLMEKIKNLQLELSKYSDELIQRDNKVIFFLNSYKFLK